MMFADAPFPARFERAARAGFRAVEFLFPYDFAAAEVSAWLSGNGLENAVAAHAQHERTTGRKRALEVGNREPCDRGADSKRANVPGAIGRGRILRASRRLARAGAFSVTG